MNRGRKAASKAHYNPTFCPNLGVIKSRTRLGAHASSVLRAHKPYTLEACAPSYFLFASPSFNYLPTNLKSQPLV